MSPRRRVHLRPLHQWDLLYRSVRARRDLQHSRPRGAVPTGAGRSDRMPGGRSRPRMRSGAVLRRRLLLRPGVRRRPLRPSRADRCLSSRYSTGRTVHRTMTTAIPAFAATTSSAARPHAAQVAASPTRNLPATDAAVRDMRGRRRMSVRRLQCGSVHLLRPRLRCGPRILRSRGGRVSVAGLHAGDGAPAADAPTVDVSTAGDANPHFVADPAHSRSLRHLPARSLRRRPLPSRFARRRWMLHGSQRPISRIGGAPRTAADRTVGRSPLAAQARPRSGSPIPIPIPIPNEVDQIPRNRVALQQAEEYTRPVLQCPSRVVVERRRQWASAPSSEWRRVASRWR